MPVINDETCLRLQEVDIDQRALVNILSRYPGTFDVLRELIQNADDAEAPIVEVRFETGQDTKFQPAGEFNDVSELKVRRWIIKNQGSFKPKDWERLGKIAAGNDDSTKVGAFGVGFYSALSKSDCPLVKSNGKSLQFSKGRDGKLCKQFAYCRSMDGWTSVELELRVLEPLPVLADLAKFLISSLSFLASIHTVSVFLDDQRLLLLRRESCGSPVDVSIPAHLMRSTPSEILRVKSIQRTVQKITIDAAEWAFASSSTSSSPPGLTADTLVERTGRSVEDPRRRNSIGAETILQESAFTHDLYTATIDVNLKSNSEMKKSVESSMKSLPSSFKCKTIYFTCEQYDSLTCINKSHLPKAKHLARLFFGPQGIVPETSGRLFIGQSTNQTTGIGLHISAHFLPTMERGSIDLANGQVAAWNNEVLWVSGLLARIIYEEEMRIAVSKDELAVQLGLRTMKRFAFGSTSPHGQVSHILQDAFFSCCRERKSPFPVVSDVGIWCASDAQFRQSNRELFFLKKYRLLHTELEPRQHSEIVKRYDIPLFKYADIVREFETGVTHDTMRSFFAWWEGTRRNLISPEAKIAGKKFCKEFASRGVLRSNRGVDITLKKIKCFTFFPLPDNLSPPQNIYIDITSGTPTRDAVECFGWGHLSLLDWVEYACAQAREFTHEVSDISRSVLRVLIQFALVEELDRYEWNKVAELMGDISCIPTNKGLRLPTESYFDEADVCRDLPVVIERDFEDIPLTSIAEAGIFLPRRASPEHVRKVLIAIGVRHMMEWRDMVERLEAVASEESNDRLLYFLAVRREFLTNQHLGDLKKKRMFYSKNQTRVPATELHFPNEEIRKLGLPILALPRNSSFLPQNIADPSGSLAMETFLEFLGIQRYPSLKKIIDQAASNDPEVHRSALQYLLSNLETRYDAYKPDDFANVAFIPTKGGSLARLNEVFASPVWEKLGFKQALESRRRDLSRLGVKDDPSADIIIERLKTPESTLPDAARATEWFDHLSSYGNLPVLVLREKFSNIPFVPVKLPGSSSSDPIKYIPPKDCFITSPETKERGHHRDIFPFVDFGPHGNSFLESCCAKKSPDASDIIRKIAQDPQKYWSALGNNADLYLEDLRTIALRLDSIPEDDKKAMRGAPMFLAFRQHVDGGKLLPAYEVIIGDWESRDFGGNVYLAPKDDMIEKMYHKMGSEYLGAYVRYQITHAGAEDKYNLPFNRDQIIQRVQCFMRQRDTEKTRLSFYSEGSTEEFRVRACKTLKMKKTLRGADGVVKHETDFAPVKVGIEHHESVCTLWVVKGSNGLVDLRNEIAVELCRALLKTFGPNDMLLLASLIAMDDEDLKRFYGTEMKSVSANSPQKGDSKRFKVELRVPPHLVGAVKLLGARVHLTGFRSSSRRAITLEDDMRRAIESSRGSDSDAQPDFNEPCHPQPNSERYNSQCKEAHKISLKEQSNPLEEGPQIKFFLAEDAQREEPPQVALQEFAKLIAGLARVFGLDASTACYMFWKDTDDDLMAFNRDKKYVFFNLAHYYKFFYTRGVEEKRVATEWFLIMAHEIAHNVTLDHNEYHGSLSARIVATYLPILYKNFSCFAGELPPQST